MTRIFDKEADRWAGLYDDNAPAPRYALFQGAAAHRTQRRAQRCLDLLDCPAGSVVLDLACGTGVLAEGVLERDLRWIGADISLPMLDLARRRLPSDAALINADAAKLPFRSDSIDAILCLGMLNFFPRAALPGLLAAIVEPLRKDGLLILTSLRLDVLTWLRSRLYPRIAPPVSCPGPLYPHHPRTLDPLLQAAGLRIEEWLTAHKYLRLPHYTMYRLRKS